MQDGLRIIFGTQLSHKTGIVVTDFRLEIADLKFQNLGQGRGVFLFKPFKCAGEYSWSGSSQKTPRPLKKSGLGRSHLFSL